MATKILKLISGEEVIGDYEERDGKHFIGKPAKLVLYPDGEGGLVPSIMPWIPFSDEDEVEIKAECIMLRPMEPAQDIRNEYNQSFGSGFVDTTPTARDIIV